MTLITKWEKEELKYYVEILHTIILHTMISLNVITLRKPNTHAHIHTPHTHKPIEFALNKTGKESKKHIKSISKKVNRTQKKTAREKQTDKRTVRTENN